MLTKVLQYVWGITALASLALGVYNLLIVPGTDYKKFLPLVVFLFCTIVFFNLRSQVKFKEKLDQKNQENQ